MSSRLKLKSTAGGSLSLIVDDTLATDEEMNISNGGIENGTWTGVNGASGYWTKFPDGTFMAHGKGTLRLGSGIYTHILDIGENQSFPVTPINYDTVTLTASITFLGNGAGGTDFRGDSSVLCYTGIDWWNVSIAAGSGDDFSAEVGKLIRWQMIGRWK